MGLSYRKSFKAGPIRLTASKSGVSYSAKVGGTRVTKRANGRVTTSTSLPGGFRYTTSSGSGATKKRAQANRQVTAKKTTAPRTSAQRSDPNSPAAVQELYREIYGDALRQLRNGEASGAALRGRLHSRGMAQPRLLQAITDAERKVAWEAKQAEQNARYDDLADRAARRLIDGEKSSTVTRWLKHQEGLGFFARGEIMGRARKIIRTQR